MALVDFVECCTSRFTLLSTFYDHVRFHFDNQDFDPSIGFKCVIPRCQQRCYLSLNCFRKHVRQIHGKTWEHIERVRFEVDCPVDPVSYYQRHLAPVSNNENGIPCFVENDFIDDNAFGDEEEEECEEEVYAEEMENEETIPIPGFSSNFDFHQNAVSPTDDLCYKAASFMNDLRNETQNTTE